MERYGYGDCSICFNTTYINNVLMPCKHNGLCIDCANQIVANHDQCPICRENVDGIIQVYSQIEHDTRSIKKVHLKDEDGILHNIPCYEVKEGMKSEGDGEDLQPQDLGSGPAHPILKNDLTKDEIKDFNSRAHKLLPKLNPLDQNHAQYKNLVRLLTREFVPKMLQYSNAQQGKKTTQKVIETLTNSSIQDIK